MSECHDPAALLREMWRQDFGAFLDKAWMHISGDEVMDYSWHIDAIGYQLDRVRTGKSRRLLINIPPRYGKSKIISIIWVAWMLGLNPALNFVCVSYATESLSGKFGRDCLSIMQSAWYRELFPGTILKRSASLDFETTRNGGRLSTSTSGTLTGRGGDIIILDDVIKPEDANSDVVRNAVNNWYRSTLSSRLNNKEKGAIIGVMQRLHQYDLPGLLLEACGWDHLSLPAIAMEDARIPLLGGGYHERRVGDILHPERESRERLERQRAEMGSSAFAAQYQQAPVPAEGNVFKAAWLKVWPAEFSQDGGGEIVMSVDTAVKTGEEHDWSVCITALLRGRSVYILDIWRGRVEFPDLKHKVVELAQVHGAHTLLIEDKSSGEELISTLRFEQHQGVPLPIPRTPVSDKVSRARGVSSMVEAGQLFLPPEAHWLGEFKAELLAFPSGRHKDQVDALTQLLGWVRDRLSVPRILNAGPELITEDSADRYDRTEYDFDDDPWAPRS